MSHRSLGPISTIEDQISLGDICRVVGSEATAFGLSGSPVSQNDESSICIFEDAMLSAVVEKRDGNLFVSTHAKNGSGEAQRALQAAIEGAIDERGWNFEE